MTSTQETIRAFYSNIENKDFEAVRGLLHDDLEFRGPIDAFDAADDLVAKLRSSKGGRRRSAFGICPSTGRSALRRRRWEKDEPPRFHTGRASSRSGFRGPAL